MFVYSQCLFVINCYQNVRMVLALATDKIQTGIRFKEEMLLKISYIAKKNCRSLNAQLEFLSQKCIEEYELDNGTIQISDEGKFLYRK